MAIKWTRDMVEQFILLYQQHECLYSTRSAEYLDRNKKASAMNAILVEMQRSCSNISLADLKKKWKGIRSQYLQEIRQMESSKKSGAGAEDIYFPKLWCFDQLQFLRNCSLIRPSKSNISNECANVEGTPLFDLSSSSSLSPSPPPAPPRTRPTKRTGPLSHKLLNGLDNVTQMVLNKNKNSKRYDWLGRLVTSEMEKIISEDQDDATWEIQCIVRKYVQKSRISSMSENSSAADILQLSLDGVFDENYFV